MIYCAKSSSKSSSIWYKNLTDLINFDCLICLTASSASPIIISQKMMSSWRNEGKIYYRYSTKLTNRSTKTLKNLKLSITKLYGPIWGVTKTGNSYGFPSWMQSLPAGKSMEFVYIHSASPANVLISNFSLGWIESVSECETSLPTCKLVNLLLKIFGLVVPID